MKDLSIIEALQCILTLAMDKIRKSGDFAEGVILKILDAVITVAVAMLKPPKGLPA